MNWRGGRPVSQFPPVTQGRQQLAHFGRRVGVTLMPRLIDPLPQVAACVVNSIQIGQLLSRHEKGGHIGRRIPRKFVQLLQAGLVIAFASHLHGQRVTQKGVGRIFSQHGLDFFSSIHGSGERTSLGLGTQILATEVFNSVTCRGDAQKGLSLTDTGRGCRIVIIVKFDSTAERRMDDVDADSLSSRSPREMYAWTAATADPLWLPFFWYFQHSF